ncbi:cob(I)yrinic acid a,c-diamide adenosyltransferase [Bacillus sp. FJAT-49711]|uniref:cob(I)yrinic acid a,c-diamide adenosyltransferase n=1 Tax=Bacillus sp. FJAT-49711 TaxID=2833585 RepID=UPI001BC99716|nr:cob(I)yrinic acid a,c-diamide adenosyltransferase [Bacillus sp. FJAT-49711]MBS4220135.1 cob(I)yrinic acid a,c-diamide adenosyltransferase [Bacillus sp. FJAT-49711]
MKIYTKTGDKGTTSLVYGERVSKNDIRVEAYGTCDEANSMIGLALSHLTDIKNDDIKEMHSFLHKVQTTLFHVGAELSTPAGKKVKWVLQATDIEELEKTIDLLEGDIPPLSNFILPGGHPAGAVLHVARTITRRAERITVSIDNVNPLVLSYLNRLSDFLFVAARFINHKLGMVELKLHE